MARSEYQLHYTHQFVKMLTEAVNHSQINFNWFQQQILSNIQRYPCQGRLFLNRNTTNGDNQRLRWQLAQRFSGSELRELSENGWLVIYMNKLPRVYLLALISLSTSGNKAIEELWLNTN